MIFTIATHHATGYKYLSFGETQGYRGKAFISMNSTGILHEDFIHGLFDFKNI